MKYLATMLKFTDREEMSAYIKSMPPFDRNANPATLTLAAGESYEEAMTRFQPENHDEESEEE